MSVLDIRSRDVPHIEGNFSTSVWVDMSASSEPLELHLDSARLSLDGRSSDSSSIMANQRLHISLSRNVYLKTHLVEAFISAMTNRLSGLSQTTWYFKPQIDMYLNDARTSLFAGIPIDLAVSPSCMHFIACVDSVLGEFDLPLYYPNPSPHVTLAWTPVDPTRFELFNSPTRGDNLDLSDDQLNDLRVDVASINVSIGNNIHTVNLR